ncbi:MAG: hypothetical protein VXZ32_01585 [Verrucomicrobiota bacterium]|nr:hypothetical protein [Verrucomicrobiota bacterium]
MDFILVIFLFIVGYTFVFFFRQKVRSRNELRLGKEISSDLSEEFDLSNHGNSGLDELTKWLEDEQLKDELEKYKE